MQINYAFINDKKNDLLESFLKEKEFSLTTMHSLKSTNGVKWIVVDNETKETFIKDVLKKLNNLDPKVTFFLPKKFYHLKTPPLCKKVYYPISFTEFEKIIKERIVFEDFHHKDITIKHNNLAINKTNNLSVFFTDTEANILKNLIVEKKIKKLIIKSDILNYNDKLNTKSLESHLSRIRKKLSSLKSTISIISEDTEYIRII